MGKGRFSAGHVQQLSLEELHAMAAIGRAMTLVMSVPPVNTRVIT